MKLDQTMIKCFHFEMQIVMIHDKPEWPLLFLEPLYVCHTEKSYLIFAKIVICRTGFVKLKIAWVALKKLGVDGEKLPCHPSPC